MESWRRAVAKTRRLKCAARKLCARGTVDPFEAMLPFHSDTPNVRTLLKEVLESSQLWSLLVVTVGVISAIPSRKRNLSVLDFGTSKAPTTAGYYLRLDTVRLLNRMASPQGRFAAKQSVFRSRERACHHLTLEAAQRRFKYGSGHVLGRRSLS